MSSMLCDTFGHHVIVRYVGGVKRKVCTQCGEDFGPAPAYRTMADVDRMAGGDHTSLIESYIARSTSDLDGELRDLLDP